jgi:hypothetical protein
MSGLLPLITLDTLRNAGGSGAQLFLIPSGPTPGGRGRPRQISPVSSQKPPLKSTISREGTNRRVPREERKMLKFYFVGAFLVFVLLLVEWTMRNDGAPFWVVVFGALFWPLTLGVILKEVLMRR